MGFRGPNDDWSALYPLGYHCDKWGIWGRLYRTGEAIKSGTTGGAGAASNSKLMIMDMPAGMTILDSGVT